MPRSGAMARRQDLPDKEPPLPYSDYTNALAFVRDHGQNLRYCYPWNAWLVWTGTHWQRDISGAVMRLAKQTVKRLARQAEDLDDARARALHGAYQSQSQYGEAQGHGRECAVRSPASPCSLRTSTPIPGCSMWPTARWTSRPDSCAPHARADLLTFALPVAYDPAATCPTWEAFLDRIMAENPNLLSLPAARHRLCPHRA